MAITTIGDIVTGNEPVILSYMTEDPVERTAFFESGILTPTPYAAEIARGPSNIANIHSGKRLIPLSSLTTRTTCTRTSQPRVTSRPAR